MRSQQRVKWAQLQGSGVLAWRRSLIFGDVLYLLTGGAIFTEQTPLYLYVPDATGLAQVRPCAWTESTSVRSSGVALSGSNDPNRVVRLTLDIGATPWR